MGLVARKAEQEKEEGSRKTDKCGGDGDGGFSGGGIGVGLRERKGREGKDSERGIDVGCYVGVG